MARPVPIAWQNPREFAEFAADIKPALKRAGKSLRWRRGVDKTKIVLFYTGIADPPQDADMEDLFVPHFDNVKLQQIPGTDYFVDSRGRLVRQIDRQTGYAMYDLTNVATREDLEAILAGLRQL